MKRLFILTFVLMLVCTNGFAMEKLTSKGDKFDVANKINEIIDYINNKECNPAECEYYKNKYNEYVDKFNQEENEQFKDMYFRLLSVFKENALLCVQKCEEFKQGDLK